MNDAEHMTMPWEVAALKAKKGGKAKAKAAKGVHITLLESALKQQTEECERLRRIIKSLKAK